MAKSRRMRRRSTMARSARSPSSSAIASSSLFCALAARSFGFGAAALPEGACARPERAAARAEATATAPARHPPGIWPSSRHKACTGLGRIAAAGTGDGGAASSGGDPGIAAPVEPARLAPSRETASPGSGSADSGQFSIESSAAGRGRSLAPVCFGSAVAEATRCAICAAEARIRAVWIQEMSRPENASASSREETPRGEACPPACPSEAWRSENWRSAPALRPARISPKASGLVFFGWAMATGRSSRAVRK